MSHQVTVAFDLHAEFVFSFAPEALAGLTQEVARRWIDREYSALDCAPSTGVGKVLVIDKILDVACQSGAQRFTAEPEWGERFAQHAALALGREVVRIDVSAYTITY